MAFSPLDKDHHVSDMKEFLYDPNVVDLAVVARRNHMEFFVEAIIDHRDNKFRTTAQFLVKWKILRDTTFHHLKSSK